MSTIEDLRVEAKRIQHQSLVAAERHLVAETPWYYLHYLLGTPSAALAAIAGATGLSHMRNSAVVAGVMALTAAVLTALLTFLDPAKTADTHHRFAKAYERLYHELGFFYRMRSQQEGADPKELWDALQGFVDTLNTLNHDSPVVACWAQRRADAHLRKGTGEVLLDPDQGSGEDRGKSGRFRDAIPHNSGEETGTF